MALVRGDREGVMVSAPSVLVVPRELDFIIAELEQSYRVLRGWEFPPTGALAHAQAMICLGHQPVDAFVASMPALKLVACYTTGFDAIDVAALNSRGIQVSHSPGVTAEPVGEFALALILASYRNIVCGDRKVRSGAWVKDGAPLIGRSITRARVGIVGMGAIGKALARRCDVLDMIVSWWGPRDKPDLPWPRAESLKELALATDILVVCASADAGNVHMISAEIIDSIGPRGLLINVGRGQLVDEEAVIEALHAGRLGAAALDVFEVEPTPNDRWGGVPNAICTPHIAGASRDNLDNMTSMVRSNLDAFFAGRPLPNPARPKSVVDYPI